MKRFKIHISKNSNVTESYFILTFFLSIWQVACVFYFLPDKRDSQAECKTKGSVSWLVSFKSLRQGISNRWRNLGVAQQFAFRIKLQQQKDSLGRSGKGSWGRSLPTWGRGGAEIPDRLEEVKSPLLFSQDSLFFGEIGHSRNGEVENGGKQTQAAL
jgi:hypothetical protein